MSVITYPESWQGVMADLVRGHDLGNRLDTPAVQIVVVYEDGRDDLSLRDAVARRRDGLGVPIVVLSFQSVESNIPSKRQESRLDELEHRILGRYVAALVPQYDIVLQLPLTGDEMRDELIAASRRYSLAMSEIAVEAAILEEMEDRGAVLDHRLSAFAAVLRLLRGAMADSLFDPIEAVLVTDHIAENLSAMVMQGGEDPRVRELLSRVLEQGEAWRSISVATAEGRVSVPVPLSGFRPINAVLIDDQHLECCWQRALDGVLGRFGVSVTSDDGGPGFMGAISGHTDIVFLDLGLPARRNASAVPAGMEGLVLFGRIREKYPHLPVVFFTSYESLALGRALQIEDSALYFVKGEKSSERDARAYCRQLIAVTEAAVQLRYRESLRAFLDEAKNRSEIARTRSCQRFRRHLGDLLDGPLVCMSSGQALEAAMYTVKPDAESLKLLIDEDVLGLGREWNDWLRLALGFRNISAHPLNCDLMLGLFDANLAAALTVLAISRGAEITTDSLLASSGLLRSSLIVCGLQLRNARSRGLRSEGEALWKLAYSSLENADLGVASSRLLRRSREEVCRLGRVLSKQGRSPSQAESRTILIQKVLQAYCPDRWGPRPGLTSLASVAQTILNRSVFSSIMSGATNACHEVSVLRLFVAARLLLWCEEFNCRVVLRESYESGEFWLARPVSLKTFRRTATSQTGKIVASKSSGESHSEGSSEVSSQVKQRPALSYHEMADQLREHLRFFELSLASAANKAGPVDKEAMQHLGRAVQKLRKVGSEQADKFAEASACTLEIHESMKVKVFRGEVLMLLQSCAATIEPTDQ